tara:strand:+ start:989 stop:1111 length:123 start_codon:yes stop_codon:yes gene_type:complete
MNVRTETNKPIIVLNWMLWAAGLAAFINVLWFFAAAFLNL